MIPTLPDAEIIGYSLITNPKTPQKMGVAYYGTRAAVQKWVADTLRVGSTIVPISRAMYVHMEEMAQLRSSHAIEGLVSIACSVPA